MAETSLDIMTAPLPRVQCQRDVCLYGMCVSMYVQLSLTEHMRETQNIRKKKQRQQRALSSSLEACSPFDLTPSIPFHLCFHLRAQLT